MNEYAVHLLVKERIEEAQAFAAKRALFRSATPRIQSARVWLGLVLVRVGHRLLGDALEPTHEPGRSC